MNDKNMNRDQTVLQALSDCAQAFLKTRDFRQAAYTVYDTCKKFIGADAGYVALLSSDETLNELLFLDMGGLSCNLDQNLPMPIRGLRARAYSTGMTVYENNFQESEWRQYLPEGHGRLENGFERTEVIGRTAVEIHIWNDLGKRDQFRGTR